MKVDVRNSFSAIRSAARVVVITLIGLGGVLAAPVDLSETRPTSVAPWMSAPLQLEEDDRFRLNAARKVFAKQFADIRPRVRGRSDLEAALDLLEIADFESALIAIDEVVSNEPEIAVAHEIRGVALAYLGRIDDAVAAFETAAKADPSQAGPLTKLGDIYMALARPEEARGAYKRATEADPKNRRAQSRLGIALEAAGFYEEAKQHLRLSLRNVRPRRQSPERIAYARALLMTGDANAAVLALEPSVNDKSDYIAKAVLGMSYLGASRYSKAAETLASLLDENKADNSLLAYFLGRAYAQKGDAKKAIEVFALSAETAPNPAIPQRDLAAVYVSEGEIEKAEQILEAISAGENATAYDSKLLGEIHAARGDLAGAETIYASMVEQFPADPMGYQKLGTIQAAQTRYDEAAATLQSGLEAAGDNVQLLRSLVLVQSRRGDREGATESAERLAAMPEVSAGALTLAGSIQEEFGNMEAAEAHYRQAINKDGNNPAALNNLAHILAQRGEYSDAKPLAEKARTIDDDNVVIAQNFGWILYNLEDHERAAKLLGEAAAKSQGDSRLYYRYGLALIGAGKTAKAKAALEKAVNGESALTPAELSDAQLRLSRLND